MNCRERFYYSVGVSTIRRDESMRGTTALNHFRDKNEGAYRSRGKEKEKGKFEYSNNNSNNNENNR